jgi:L-seryl-tRNA(Ser) seleniumtransferase
LAEITGNEAAYVSNGAASGIALLVAACMTGGETGRVLRLPDSAGMKNEVVVFASQRNMYDHAIRAPGARIVAIGGDEAELAAAITPNTAALLWFQGAMTGHGDIPLERVIALCRERGVPVLVDAAAQLPPLDNLWRFTRMGAAAAVFSGGKDLRGPQGSGLVVGQRALVDLLYQIGSPNKGFARGMKVSKEDLVGLLAAVRRYIGLDHKAKRERDEQVVAAWIGDFTGLAGVRAERAFPNEAGQPLPRLRLALDSAHAGIDAESLAQRLMAGTPAIAVATEGDAVYVNPWLLEENEVDIVRQRLLDELRSPQRCFRGTSPDK